MSRSDLPPDLQSAKASIRSPAIPQLPTGSLDVTEAFFREKLGFDESTRFDGFLILCREAVEIHFWLAGSEDEARHYGSASSCYVRVDQIDPIYQEFKARGAPFRYEPTTMPWGMIEMQIDDPYGNAIRFGQDVETSFDQESAKAETANQGPARAGVLIYAKQLPEMEAFYADVLGLRRQFADASHIVLGGPDGQLILHAIPAAIAQTIEIARPAVAREEQAIKPFFTVLDWASSLPKVEAHGGQVLGPIWDGPGFCARNICDPEGNIVQLRVFSARGPRSD